VFSIENPGQLGIDEASSDLDIHRGLASAAFRVNVDRKAAWRVRMLELDVQWQGPRLGVAGPGPPARLDARRLQPHRQELGRRAPAAEHSHREQTIVLEKIRRDWKPPAE
jgi:hypothetical protein